VEFLAGGLVARAVTGRRVRSGARAPRCGRSVCAAAGRVDRALVAGLAGLAGLRLPGAAPGPGPGPVYREGQGRLWAGGVSAAPAG
jgi:hypothetical protein